MSRARLGSRRVGGFHFGGTAPCPPGSHLGCSSRRWSSKRNR